MDPKRVTHIFPSPYHHAEAVTAGGHRVRVRMTQQADFTMRPPQCGDKDAALLKGYILARTPRPDMWIALRRRACRDLKWTRRRMRRAVRNMMRFHELKRATCHDAGVGSGTRRRYVYQSFDLRRNHKPTTTPTAGEFEIPRPRDHCSDVERRVLAPGIVALTNPGRAPTELHCSAAVAHGDHTWIVLLCGVLTRPRGAIDTLRRHIEARPAGAVTDDDVAACFQVVHRSFRDNWSGCSMGLVVRGPTRTRAAVVGSVGVFYHRRRGHVVRNGRGDRVVVGGNTLVPVVQRDTMGPDAIRVGRRAWLWGWCPAARVLGVRQRQPEDFPHGIRVHDVDVDVRICITNVQKIRFDDDVEVGVEARLRAADAYATNAYALDNGTAVVVYTPS